MTPTVLTSIVEGHGELDALPQLLRRLLVEVYDRPDVQLRRPHRLPRDRFESEHLARAVRAQSAAVTGAGGVLVLVDADDDCPVDLAGRVRTLLPRDVAPTEIVVADREFEAWFLAAVLSLRDHRAVRDDAALVRDPDAVRGAKEALSARMVEIYRPVLHQPAFAAAMDLDQARQSRSFRRLVAAVGGLL